MLCQLAVQAQRIGAIGGKVSAPSGNGIEGVSILFKESGQSTLKGPDGTSRVDGLSFGEYTVIAQGLGFDVESRQVILTKEASTATINFTLKPSINALQEVEILGRKETTYKSEYSFIGTKTASLVIDVPQTISSVTKELMEDQQAFYAE